MEIAPDAKVYAKSGTEMHLYPRKKHSHDTMFPVSREMAEWLDSNLEGEWVVTPTYIGFEHETDFIIFKLRYS